MNKLSSLLALVASAQSVSLNNPVKNPPYNNWSVNQPSAPHDSGLEGKEDLGLKNIVIDGVNGFDFVQTQESGPYQLQNDNQNEGNSLDRPGKFKIHDRVYHNGPYDVNGGANPFNKA